MDELEGRRERVLSAAREGMTPSAADTARTRRALLAATAGVAVGVGAGSTAAAAGAVGAKATGTFAALSGLSTGAKVVSALALSATIGAGVLATRSSPPTPAAPTVPAVVAPVAAQQALEAPAAQPAPAAPEPPAADVPSPANRAPKAAASTAPAAGPDPLTAELALIERARQALKTGNPQGALAALAEHKSRFEHGVMAQERAALRALALCSLGDPRGREEAQRFLEQMPSSPLAAHLRAGCQ